MKSMFGIFTINTSQRKLFFHDYSLSVDTFSGCLSFISATFGKTLFFFFIKRNKRNRLENWFRQNTICEKNFAHTPPAIILSIKHKNDFLLVVCMRDRDTRFTAIFSVQDGLTLSMQNIICPR